MSNLNKDVLFLIFEELKHDKKSLYSCLFVNRTWCETVVPILWKNPGQCLTTVNSYKSIPILWKIPSQKHSSIDKLNILFRVIFLHLSEESRDILRNQRMSNFITEDWKIQCSYYKKRNIKLFINKNAKFIHLSIPCNFDYRLHLTPGAECCFSKLESFHCDFNTDQNVIKELAKICKSIKNIRFLGSYCPYNSGIIKLIEVQKKLNDVGFIGYYNGLRNNESFHKSLEESLIRHADTVQYLRMDWKPITRILSYLPNLLSLEINLSCSNWNVLDYLRNLSLLNLRILKTKRVPSEILAKLIEDTKGSLSEISIDSVSADNRRLIQAIYQNCSNLRYLKLSFDCTSIFISEFENLLINCKLLNGFIIEIRNDYVNIWDVLFVILVNSAPISLFKFKFYSMRFELKDLKLFLNNWKNRNPVLLEIGLNGFHVHSPKMRQQSANLLDLFENYKVKGIIEKYSIDYTPEETFIEFKWN